MKGIQPREEGKLRAAWLLQACEWDCELAAVHEGVCAAKGIAHGAGCQRGGAVSEVKCQHHVRARAGASR